jgi:site-specific DNA-cytosine methylase
VYVTKNKYNVRYKVYEKYIAVPIQKIEREVYKGRVYNIETTDNLYLVSNLVVHNCERLQTLPDNYTKGISNAQRYAALGNGWTVDVIAHILKHIIE